MTHRQLITASKTHYAALALHSPLPRPAVLFPSGAQWMYDRLHELQPASMRPFNPAVNYNWYGGMKYGICLAGLVMGFIAPGIWAIPVGIALFYLLEVHLLFLFPLLIDDEPRPLQASIRATYKVGVGKCLTMVLPIAGFMLIGLLQKTDRLRNWYVGCLAIIIWYDHEIRARL
jgi:hypothetical protein